MNSLREDIDNKSILYFLLAILMAYGLLFLILMDRRIEAMDDDYNVCNAISFRYSGVFPVHDDEGIRRLYRARTFWNTFFYPMEKIVVLFAGKGENPNEI